MKAILLVLCVFIITAFVQPVINLSFAQNCTCAECGYPCKTPMVHASNCKYKNNRNAQEKSEDIFVNKGLETEAIDTEYQLLIIHYTVKTIAANQNLDDSEKSKLLLEQQSIIEKIKPENDAQKMMYSDILAEINKLNPGLKKVPENNEEVKNR